MNMETGEIISSDHADFEKLFNKGVLMPLDEAGETASKELKARLKRTERALDDTTPLSKNEAKRRRKSIKNKKVRV